MSYAIGVFRDLRLTKVTEKATEDQAKKSDNKAQIVKSETTQTKGKS